MVNGNGDTTTFAVEAGILSAAVTYQAAPEAALIS